MGLKMRVMGITIGRIGVIDFTGRKSRSWQLVALSLQLTDFQREAEEVAIVFVKRRCNEYTVRY